MKPGWCGPRIQPPYWSARHPRESIGSFAHEFAGRDGQDQALFSRPHREANRARLVYEIRGC